MEEKQPFAIKPFSVEEVEEFEFLLQKAFFTANAHLCRTWPLSVRRPRPRTRLDSRPLNHSSRLSQKGWSRSAPIEEFAVIELKECLIPDPAVLEHILQEEPEYLPTLAISVSAPGDVYPLGLLDYPTDGQPVKYYVLFGLRLGTCCTVNRFSDLSTVDWTYFESAVFFRSDENDASILEGALKYAVKLRSPDQGRPLAVLETEFTPLRLEVPPLICSVCRADPADFYCPADETNLCAACDQAEHGVDAIFAAHKRLPVEASPMLFGTCSTHQNEDPATRVCLDCHRLLCVQCLQIGSHAASEKVGHKLLTTVAALEAAREEVRGADMGMHEEQQHRASALVLAKVREADALTTKLDEAACEAFSALRAIAVKRTGMISSLEYMHKLTTQIADWVGSFIESAKFALLPGDFLYVRQRHSTFARWFPAVFAFWGGPNVPAVLPEWLLSPISVRGSIAYVEPSMRDSSDDCSPRSPGPPPEDQDHDAENRVPPSVEDVASKEVFAGGSIGETRSEKSGKSLDLGSELDVAAAVCRENGGGCDDGPRTGRPATEAEEKLWRLLRDYSSEALLFFLRAGDIVPGLRLPALVSQFAIFAAAAGDFHGFVETVLRWEIHVIMESAPAELLEGRLLCLSGPLVHTVVEDHMPEKRWLDGALTPVLQPFAARTPGTSAPGADDVAATMRLLVSRLTVLGPEQVPMTLLRLFATIARNCPPDGLAVHDLQFPGRILRQNDPFRAAFKQDKIPLAATLIVFFFCRYVLAPWIESRFPRACRAIALEVRAVAEAVWVPPAGAGAEMTHAKQLIHWVHARLLLRPETGVLQSRPFERAEQDAAVGGVCDAICAVDSFAAAAAEHSSAAVRNYDQVVVRAMTMRAPGSGPGGV